MTDVLKGVRVVELGTMITAPLAGMMLADLGADVLKVEHPQGGDPFRSFRGGLYSPHFVAYNRGKRSIKLDLRSDAGRAVLLKLARARRHPDRELPRRRDGAAWARRRRAARRQPEADPLLDHRLRHVRSLQRAAGLRQCRAGALRHREPPARSRGAAGLRPDHPGQCHRHVSPATASSARSTSASARGRGRRVEVNMLEAAISFIPDPFANLHADRADRNDRLTRVASSHSFALRCSDGKLLAVQLSSQPKFWEGSLRRARAARARARRALRDARSAHQELCRARPACWTTSSRPSRAPLDGGASKPTTCRSRRSTPSPRCSTTRRCGTSGPSTRCSIRPKGEITAIRRPVLIDGEREAHATRGADARRAHRRGAGRTRLRRR